MGNDSARGLSSGLVVQVPFFLRIASRAAEMAPRNGPGRLRSFPFSGRLFNEPGIARRRHSLLRRWRTPRGRIRNPECPDEYQKRAPKP